MTEPAVLPSARQETSAGSALAAAGWAEVSDQLLNGLSFDLEGRVGSLSGLLRLVEMQAHSRTMGEFVTAEVDRLHEVVGLLAILRRGQTGAEPAAIEPGVQMPRLLDLIARVREYEQVRYRLDIDSGASALGAPDLHARLQLCALSLAGWESLARDHRVEIEVRDDAAGVLTRLTTPGDLVDSVERPPAAACPGGIGELARVLGGRTDWIATPECARLEIRMPAAP